MKINRNELDLSKIFDCTHDGVKYVNSRIQTPEFSRFGTLYVMQPHNQLPFHPFMPAKTGDIGRDLPVRIKGMRDVENTVRVSPYDPGCINWEEGWVDIPGRGWAELPSGIYVKIPEDAWGLIKTRSSTGWTRKLAVFEGTIDMYTGMLCCLAYNPHDNPVRIHDGDKLAQFILVPRYRQEEQVYVSELPVTERGSSGFGSSGH